MQSWRTPSTSGGAPPLSAELPEPALPNPEAARGRRVRWWHVALAAIVTIAAIGRFAASLGIDTPWIAPDEMVYAILGRSFWTTGHLQLLDGKSSFYGVYPILAGAPLAAFGPDTGLVVLKALQALLATVPVVTIYLWTRPMTRAGWALAAAAMTAALPAFVYSGLVMTEVTFLAVVTLALWRLWSALLDPSRWNQALVLILTAAAVAIRLKSFILVPAILLAIGAMAWFVRDGRLLRRFLPSALVVAAGLALALVVAATRGSAAFGPYGGAVGRGYHLSKALHWIAYQAGDVLLLVMGIPLVAAIALTVSCLRRRESGQVSALVAVLVPYCVLLVLEAGIYVSRYEGRINERTMVTLVPPFFVALAVWLDRGMPRAKATVIAVAAIAVVACFWPVDRLVVSAIVPDSFTPVPLFDLSLHTTGSTLRLVWVAVVAVSLILPLALPRRFAAVLPLVVIAGLLTSSVLAETKIAGRASADRQTFFDASSPQWVDRAAPGPVAYLDDDPLWAGSWHLAYWNPKITLVSLVRPPTGSRPDDATAAPQSDGEVLDESAKPLPQRLVLAPTTMTLVGRPLAHGDQGGDEPGLTLWATPSTPRLLTWTHGVLPEPMSVDVYRCSGALDLTIAARSGRPDVFISVNQLAPTVLSIPPGRSVRLRVPAAPLITSYACTYTIRTDGDIAVTGLTFKRAAVPPGQPTAGTTKVTRLGNSPLPGYAPPATPPSRPRLAYCVDGNFRMLPAGNHPGGSQAVFVEGTGLTCSAPDGYVQQGYASDGVPPGIYPLYVPPPG